MVCSQQLASKGEGRCGTRGGGRWISGKIPFALGLLVLAGCTLYRAVTLESDDATSFKRNSQKVTVETFDPQHCPYTKTARLHQEQLLLPVLAGAAAGIATLGLNVAESEIDSFIAKKQKEFTATYSGQLNLPYYYIRGTDNSFQNPTLTCLRLTRTINDPATKKDVVAFEWVGKLVPNDSGTALSIQTVALNLNRAAARTDAKTRKVDITVEVKADATYLNDKPGQTGKTASRG